MKRGGMEVAKIRSPVIDEIADGDLEGDDGDTHAGRLGGRERSHT